MNMNVSCRREPMNFSAAMSRFPVCRKSFGEGEGRVYESDEDPLDLYSPVEGKIEIKLRW